ncbi:MAG TPA: hypothetical protein VK100_01825 [Pseudogracilibacillus sp.]|nr:hypothetical protein [Pseudogracilibacillus sp.]
MEKENQSHQRSKWQLFEIIGVVIILIALVVLFLTPDSLSKMFDTIFKEVTPVVVDTFLTSEVGMAVIVSVVIGRLLERLGFTDGLIRIFVPVMRWMKINPAVIIPSAYNLLGDINAAGKIAGPILLKANATKSEQKIAVATMVQSPQSFATFVLGLMALSVFNINAFPLIILAIFAPMVVVPFILKMTIYRDTKKIRLYELPLFTPNTTFFNTIFSSAKEGTRVLFLVIIPAVVVVFILIGILRFAGIWQPIETGMASLFTMLSIEADTGITSFLVAPTLAVADLANVASSIDPRLIVGSFVLANSGLPIYVLIGQIPAIWAESTDLLEKEVIGAALIGMVIRIVTACILGFFLTPLLVVS